MDAKIVAVLALVLAALCLSDGECARGGGRAGTWLQARLRAPGSARGRDSSSSAPPGADPVQTAPFAGALPPGAASSPARSLAPGTALCTSRPGSGSASAERGPAG